MRGHSITRRWIIGLGAIGFCGTLVQADTYHWSSAVSGNWIDAPNWTPIGVPGAVSPVGSPPTPNSDVAIFDAAGPTYTVTSDARNVHELQLNSPNLRLNFPTDGVLRADRLVLTSVAVALVTVNHNGKIDNQSFTGGIQVNSAGSVNFLTNDTTGIGLNIGSSPESAGTPSVLSLPNGPLNIAGLPATGAIVSSSIHINPNNGLPGRIDVGGGALYAPTQGPGGGYLFFQGPALAEPSSIGGSLYLGGWGRFEVDTQIDNGLFMLAGGDVRINPGRVLYTSTLHWGQPGVASTSTIRGDVTLTQPGQAAELDYGTAVFIGTLSGDLRIHSSTKMQFDGTLNGDLQLDSTATLTFYDFGTNQVRVNGTVTADANSFIDISPVYSKPTHVVADQFAGSTTLRLLDRLQWPYPPEPGIYRGILETTDGDFPAGFVAEIQYNTSWTALTVTSQIDPDDAGMFNLILTAAPGDADVDGFINFNDLLSLAKNYGRTNSSWFSGDFDADGITGFSDLLVLAQHYGQHPLNTDAVPADFAADWALAQSMVPEPTTALGFASGALLVRRRVRRATA